MIDFEKSFIILGKAGMSPKRDFSLTSACVQPPPRVYQATLHILSASLT